METLKFNVKLHAFLIRVNFRKIMHSIITIIKQSVRIIKFVLQTFLSI